MEPLLPSTFPERAWQKVGTDIFHWEGKNYLLVVDYFSQFIEIMPLCQITFAMVITGLQSIFVRHGNPEVVVSGNGRQYTSEAFQEFSHRYYFDHITSRPHFPQSNGEAERAVQTIKGLL